MGSKKDELISASELARRIDIDPSYINRRRQKFKDAKCMFGKKFYYRKSCDFLGKDPDDPHKSRQSELQEEIKATKKPQKPQKKEITKSNELKKHTGENNDESEDEPKDGEAEAKELLEQILESVKGGNSRENRSKLDTLRLKAGVLREYFTAKNEEIKNRKLADNLFERDEVIQILSFAMNMVRNSLINMPNNYAVNLDGLDQKQIKDYVTDDVNKILEDLQKAGDQFE